MTSARAIAFVALGSNLGAREAHLAFARERLAGLPSTSMLAASDVEETEPLGGLDQPAYLNQMIAIETSLDPRALLALLHETEQARGRGRERGARWASRTLDLDLVVYDEMSVDEPGLVLPHPGLADRDFWQRQLAAVRDRLPGPP